MAHHDEYVALISAAIDGALSPAEQAELERHLTSCSDCRALYHDLQRLHLSLRELPPVEVPAGLTQRVMEAVAADNIVTLPKKPTLQWKRWAATAAILALILVGAGGMGLIGGRDLVAPASESTEADDPALMRSLPEESQVEVTLPTNGAETAVQNEVDQQNVPPEEDLFSIQNAQGTGEAPTPTAEPTQVPVPPTQAPSDVATTSMPPVGGDEDPEGSPAGYAVNPMTQNPVVPIPIPPMIPEGEDELPVDESELGVMSVKLGPEMAEDELAAMDRVRLTLELPDDYLWENGVTALWPGEGAPSRLIYTGLDSGGSCYLFEFWGPSLSAGDPQSVLRSICEVPINGGDILVSAAPYVNPD